MFDHILGPVFSQPNSIEFGDYRRFRRDANSITTGAISINDAGSGTPVTLTVPSI